jgi:hypothetical protein
MPVPTAESSNTAVAPGPATSDTPTGRPEPGVVLKPVRIALLVPSNTLSPLGKSSIFWLSAAPSVSTKLVEKLVGAS